MLDLTRIAGALHRTLQDVNEAGSRGNNWLLHTRTARLLGAAGRKRDALYHLDLASRLAPKRLERVEEQKWPVQ